MLFLIIVHFYNHPHSQKKLSSQSRSNTGLTAASYVLLDSGQFAQGLFSLFIFRQLQSLFHIFQRIRSAVH